MTHTGTLIKPRLLAAGARIAIVAPASAFDRAEFDAGLAELRALGFEPVFDERVFARSRFTAGDPAVRASVINEAWHDPRIDGLIAVRGGYGSAQVIPLLDLRTLVQAGKPFIGYSDLTALLWLHVRAGVVAFHGPMLEQRFAAGPGAYDRASFLGAVSRPEPMGELAPNHLEVLRPGDASGMLVGGTLTQLVSSLGTSWAFMPPPGCLLFLEDRGERPYRVHRMLTQLAQANVLARAHGIIFGEWPGCDEPSGAHPIRDVLREFVADFPGPVLFGFPSGHTTGPTWTLPFGVHARVITSPPALVIDEAAVS